MMNFLKIILLLTCVIHGAYANQPTIGTKGFGSPCAPTNISATINSFLVESSYGYLQSFIDMTANLPYNGANPISGNCNDNLPKLDICFYNEKNSPPCDFRTFQIGDSHTISTIVTNPTLQQDPFLQNLYLTASMLDANNLCLTMSTPYGQAPLVCKHVITAPPPPVTPSCVSASQSCIGVNYSQSIFNFSGSAVECVTDVLNNIFFDTTQCPSNEESYLSSLKAFASFQKVLQGTVGALLILYCMMFGFNMILNQDKFSLESVVKFLLKFVLVLYFSVGIGSYFNSQGQNTVHNGMTDWGLPILREITNDFTQMAFAAGGSRQLCYFDISQYPEGHKGYALWDIVDCKMGAYLGVKSVYNLGAILTNTNFIEIAKNLSLTDVLTLDNGPDLLNSQADTPEFGFPYMILLLLTGGNLLAMISIIAFIMIFFSISVGFISVYVVCLITLHVLVYISPIFIPMALFEYTNKYFQAWLKAIVSCALQPMIIGGFVALMMTMYDYILFGPPVSAYNSTPGCEFITHQYQYSGTTNGTAYTQNYNTFEMVLPSSDPSSCTDNIGYQLIAYTLGEGYTSIDLLILSIPQIKDTLDMAANCLILMVFSFVFYYFSSTLYDFAADITGGISVKGVALNVVQAVMNAPVRAIKAIASRGKSEAKKDGGKDKGKDGKEGGDKGGGAPKRGGGNKGGGSGVPKSIGK